MFDFAALPPEVISSAMHSGPGAASLMAAAASWSALADQLDACATNQAAVVSELDGRGWSGASAQAMIAATTPYLGWLTETAALAEQAAVHIRAAAAAYEKAFAAVVPPALILANRAELARLVATNVFGQNSPRIAHTEAAYAHMWADDAQAMSGYAASSSTATALDGFHEPPQAAAAGDRSGGTSALAQATGSISQQLSGPASPTTPDPLGTSGMVAAVDQLNTMDGPAGFAEANSRTVTSLGSFLSGIWRGILQSQGSAAKALPELAPPPEPAPPIPVATASGAAAEARHTVLASAGTAEPVAGMSVPPGWSTAVPEPTAFAESPFLSEIEIAESAVWETVPEADIAGAAPTTGMGPLAATAGTAGGGRVATVSNTLRIAPRRFSMPRPTLGG